MELNFQKSDFYCHNISRGLLTSMLTFCPLDKKDLSIRFKCLGFHLNPNNYVKNDWCWLLGKLEAKVNFWCNHWLSCQGHLVLINEVMEAIPSYWNLLAFIPKGIFHKIRKLCSNLYGEVVNNIKGYIQ